MKTTIATALALLALMLPALSSCQTGSTQTSTTEERAAHRVSIEAVAFNPSEIRIRVGDSVTWVNKDTIRHTTTSWQYNHDEDMVIHALIGEIWDSGEIQPGESYTRTFHERGIYQYITLPLAYYQDFVLGAVGKIIVE